MKVQLIREIVEEEASRLVPDEVNLWPVISTRLAARARRWVIGRVVRRGVIVALLVFIIALLTSRQLQVAVAGVLAEVVGARGGPGQPTVFTPSPPFVVRQPGYLPPGFKQGRMIYNPGFDPQTIPTAMALSGNPTPSGTAPAHEAFTLFEAMDKNADPSRAAILFIYRAEAGSELWLYERATLPDDKAVLEVDEQWLMLTWIEDGTWLVLRGTLGREEIMRVAEGLVVTQRPGAGETGGSGFPGPMMDVRVATMNPTNASIWTGDPKLGQVPNQIYHGHVVVEVWDKGETMFAGPSDENGIFAGGLKAADLFKRVIEALQDPQTPIITVTPWTDDPIGGPQPNLGRYRGRVIADVWEKQVNIAITGPEATSVLAQRAVQRLQSELKWQSP